MHARPLLSSFLLAILATPLLAQALAPKPPAEYDVIIRYRIDAARTERILQFREMVRYLESIGFKKDPSENENEEEDRFAVEMTGTIASSNVRKILAEPHVRTILLVAKGVKLPTEAEADQFVRTDLDLASGLKDSLQDKLYDQTRAVLRSLGFQEAVGYDNRGNSRIVGNVAAKNLIALLRDLRETPAGAKEGNPFLAVTPIRVVEVQPGRELAKPLPEQPKVPAELSKIAPDLRALLADKDEAAKPHRLEVILWTTPSATDSIWAQALRRAAPGLVVEGQLGALVSVLVPADRAVPLASLSIVSGVRLPRAARQESQPAGPGKDAVEALGLHRLHAMGFRGRRVRIAIVDADFHDYREMIKAKRLPAGTRLVDLTAARNPDLLPDAFPTSAGLGHGTRCALAAAQAAPEADIVLIRVDPAAPYQLQEAARYISGETFQTPSLEERSSELAGENALLSDRREKLFLERKVLLDSGLPIEEFEPKWADYKKRQETFENDERAYEE
ncbi:MAG TPA: hypothetical protein VKE94_20390, partial [Gemmataceae bacterium]|nr:hypothetical protein [Gemmataceae bacterium]